MRIRWNQTLMPLHRSQYPYPKNPVVQSVSINHERWNYLSYLKNQSHRFTLIKL